MGQGVGFMTEMKPARYCHVVDGRQWKDLAQLFTEKPLVSTGSWVFLGRCIASEIIASRGTLLAREGPATAQLGVAQRRQGEGAI